MKRVSFKIAKAIKEASYPQGPEDYAYRSNGAIYIFEDIFDHIPDYCCDAPTYMDVWLWLWEEKGIYIQVGREYCTLSFKWGDSCTFITQASPEETIAKAIEYLVENDLIK